MADNVARWRRLPSIPCWSPNRSMLVPPTPSPVLALRNESQFYEQVDEGYVTGEEVEYEGNGESESDKDNGHTSEVDVGGDGDAGDDGADRDDGDTCERDDKDGEGDNNEDNEDEDDEDEDEDDEDGEDEDDEDKDDEDEYIEEGDDEDDEADEDIDDNHNAECYAMVGGKQAGTGITIVQRRLWTRLPSPRSGTDEEALVLTDVECSTTNGLGDNNNGSDGPTSAHIEYAAVALRTINSNMVPVHNSDNCSYPISNEKIPGPSPTSNTRFTRMKANEAVTGSGATTGVNHSLHRYQVQLSMLEQPHRKRRVIARQEQDSNTRARQRAASRDEDTLPLPENAVKVKIQEPATNKSIEPAAVTANVDIVQTQAAAKETPKETPTAGTATTVPTSKQEKGGLIGWLRKGAAKLERKKDGKKEDVAEKKKEEEEKAAAENVTKDLVAAADEIADGFVMVPREGEIEDEQTIISKVLGQSAPVGRPAYRNW